MERETIDVGIIVPLQEEFDVLAKEFGGLKRDVPGLDPLRAKQANPVGTYWRLNGPEGRRVVAVVCSDMGPEWAAIATERMLHRFEVGLICQVGIAGSIDNDLQLGDVIVPSDIWAYHQSMKLSETGESVHWKLGGTDFPLPPHVLECARNLKRDPGTLRRYQRWQDKAAADRPPVAGGLEEEKHVRRKPECYVGGKLASGPFVIASEKAYKEHLEPGTRLGKAVEMEGAGVAAAMRAYWPSLPLLVVRGISDFADARKSEIDAHSGGGWRQYAARNAALMLRELLALCIPQPEAPATSDQRPRRRTRKNRQLSSSQDGGERLAERHDTIGDPAAIEARKQVIAESTTAPAPSQVRATISVNDLEDLHDVLMNIYPAPVEIQRRFGALLGQGGVDLPLNDPRETWRTLLEEAQEMGTIHELIDIAAREHYQNEPLRTAARAYLERVLVGLAEQLSSDLSNLEPDSRWIAATWSTQTTDLQDNLEQFGQHLHTVCSLQRGGLRAKRGHLERTEMLCHGAWLCDELTDCIDRLVDANLSDSSRDYQGKRFEQLTTELQEWIGDTLSGHSLAAL